MSENTELIHWHLKPHSVALLVEATRDYSPAVANSVFGRRPAGSKDKI